MNTDRNIQKIGLINLLALLLIGGALAMVSRQAGSATGLAGAVFVGLGLFVAAVAYFQSRLEARERIEKMEFDEISKGPASSALFTQEAETFPARRSREQFERFFVPGFTVAMCLLQGAAAFYLWRWLRIAPRLLVDQATLAMALSSLFSLLFFLIGKYSAGIARLEGQRLLRPAASYLLLGALASFAAAVCDALAWFGFPLADGIAARVLAVVLGLVAVETLVSVILEIYRPRVKGQAARLLYESRLIGLLGQPGGLITTAAQALDYQFGFKVSETWFYHFLEKALAWIVLLQLAVLMLSTTVVVVRPPEQGLLERFGKPVAGREVLEPGLHFKWPWPIDKAYLFATREIHTLYVGFTPEADSEKDRVILWTRQHYTNEFDLLVAARENITTSTGAGERVVPVNLLTVNIPVQYRVRDVRAWLSNHADAEELLESVANREVVRYLINVDIDDLMTLGRSKAAEALRRNIQARSDRYGLGVEVVYVSLESVHPPLKVAKDYEEVIAALHDRASNILSAQAYWAEKIPTTYAEATNLLTKSDSDATAKVTTASAKAGQFANQMAAWNASPEVYRQRSYLETLARSIGGARKYVLTATNTQDIIWLNLEDKMRSDMEDLSLRGKR